MVRAAMPLLVSTILALGGCAVVPASTMTFANTTVPVTVGPVARVGGEAQRPPEPRASVRAEAKNQYQFTSSAGGGGTVYHQTEDATKFDVAVDEALGDCRGCAVRVDHLYFGSHSAVLIGTSDDTHWTGADLHLVGRDE